MWVKSHPSSFLHRQVFANIFFLWLANVFVINSFWGRFWFWLRFVNIFDVFRVFFLPALWATKTRYIFFLSKPWQQCCLRYLPTQGLYYHSNENLIPTKCFVYVQKNNPMQRPLWRHYYNNTNGVIFVVDSNDKDRVNKAHDELHKMMAEVRRFSEIRLPSGYFNPIKMINPDFDR